MNYFLEYWQNHKKMTIVIIVFTLIIYIISLVFVANKVNEMAENHYRPVRMSAASEKIQVCGIFSDPDDVSKIKSASFFHIENHSSLEQKVTFVVYHHNIWEDEDYFFDIDYIYIDRNTDAEEMIKDGIVKIAAGEKLYIIIEATARDSSKALTSRGGPSVETVILEG